MSTGRSGGLTPGNAEVGSQVDDELRIVRSRVDLGGLPPLSRAVTEQVVRATADPSYVTDLVYSEPWLEAAVAALAAGAPLIADTAMVAVGIACGTVICKVDDSLTQRLARSAGITLAAAAVRLAFGEAGPSAIWVVGSEPMAIREILVRETDPTLVIGMPAGFGAAAEAKKLLRDSGVPALTNVSGKGGAVAAVAACGALLRAADGVGIPESAS